MPACSINPASCPNREVCNGGCSCCYSSTDALLLIVVIIVLSACACVALVLAVRWLRAKQNAAQGSRGGGGGHAA